MRGTDVVVLIAVMRSVWEAQGAMGGIFADGSGGAGTVAITLLSLESPLQSQGSIS